MELASKYNPTDVEGKWYQYWLDNKLFHSEPDGREPYTVVIPPPNVKGVLHMGHMLNNTIQDILVRRARMLGKNACWVPGTDHASIATDPVCIVMGAEDKGIPAEHLALCDEWISIPQFGHIQSLNVSVAAGVLIYEAVRQRSEA